MLFRVYILKLLILDKILNDDELISQTINLCQNSTKSTISNKCHHELYSNLLNDKVSPVITYDY